MTVHVQDLFLLLVSGCLLSLSFIHVYMQYLLVILTSSIGLIRKKTTIWEC